MGLRKFLDRMHPEPTETANATRMEANRQLLIREDLDAKRILTTSFEIGQASWKDNGVLTNQMAAYADAKAAANRIDLYHRLFAGIDA